MEQINIDKILKEKEKENYKSVVEMFRKTLLERALYAKSESKYDNVKIDKYHEHFVKHLNNIYEDNKKEVDYIYKKAFINNLFFIDREKYVKLLDEALEEKYNWLVENK